MDQWFSNTCFNIVSFLSYVNLVLIYILRLTWRFWSGVTWKCVVEHSLRSTGLYGWYHKWRYWKVSKKDVNVEVMRSFWLYCATRGFSTRSRKPTNNPILIYHTKPLTISTKMLFTIIYKLFLPMWWIKVNLMSATISISIFFATSYWGKKKIQFGLIVISINGFWIAILW